MLVLLGWLMLGGAGLHVLLSRGLGYTG